MSARADRLFAGIFARPHTDNLPGIIQTQHRASAECAVHGVRTFGQPIVIGAKTLGGDGITEWAWTAPGTTAIRIIGNALLRNIWLRGGTFVTESGSPTFTNCKVDGVAFP